MKTNNNDYEQCPSGLWRQARKTVMDIIITTCIYTIPTKSTGQAGLFLFNILRP